MSSSSDETAKHSASANLEDIEQKAAQLQAAGDNLAAITQFDQALSLKMEVFGLGSAEVIAAGESLALLCNTAAMRLMAEGQAEESLQLLKNAELLTGPNGCLPQGETRAKVRAVTMNNLGCYYKK
jgi:hypothetical protein